MRPWLKWTLIVFAVLVMLVSIQIFRRLDELGLFVGIEKVSPGQCRTIASPPGVEDIAIDRLANVALLSSDDRRATMAEAPVEGGIYALDLTDPGKPAVLLTGPASGTAASFHPHGISLFTAPDGSRTLMVVNHPVPGGMFNVDPQTHAIEIYDVVENAGALALVHRRRLVLSEISAPNDIVAVGSDSFYVTNMMGSETSFGAALEAAFNLRRANVVYVDGKGATRVVEGLAYANGINVSPDGKTIYVAESGARRLSAYARDEKTGALVLANDQFFGTGLDNIEINPDGALWIAAHPRMIDFLRHAGDPSVLSPSQIIRVEPQAGGAARTLYTDDGGEFSAASVAVEWHKKIIAGAVFDAKLLICDWTNTPGADAPPPQ